MNRTKGFTLVELLVVIAIIAILAAIIIPSYQRSRLKANNAAIVSTMSNLHSVIDASKYPGSLAAVCNDFEPGGEFYAVKESVEKNGGIWYCDSTEDAYRIFVKLHTSVTLAQTLLGGEAYAQESIVHNFGNYFCVNSEFQSNFTHWSGENLVYPSCNDGDYTATTQDPEPAPEPTPDPDPEPNPEPPIEESGSACEEHKTEVCHFSKTICVDSSALKAHLKHGDTEGSC